jgi:hypothetical protein
MASATIRQMRYATLDDRSPDKAHLPAWAFASSARCETDDGSRPNRLDVTIDVHVFDATLDADFARHRAEIPLSDRCVPVPITGMLA